jgi:hypothetical protein
VPEVPAPPFEPQTCPRRSGDDEEAPIRLRVDTLVRRLQHRPQELAERAVRQVSDAPETGCWQCGQP